MTEESPSETSSEIEGLQARIAELYEMLRWNVGILTVLLQEAGGLVEIDKATLEGIDVMKVRTVVSYDEEKEIYKVEGVFEDES